MNVLLGVFYRRGSRSVGIMHAMEHEHGYDTSLVSSAIGIRDARRYPVMRGQMQGGSSRRDYGSSGSGTVGGRGGGSSSRYHEGGSSSSSYDKRGSNEHHSSSSGTADSSSRSKFDHHRSSSSASRSHGGGGGGGGGGDSSSSYRSRDNSTTNMGPPRSVAMRSNHSSSSGGRSMMRPPMGGGHRSHLGGSSLMGSGGMHRRGSGMMRGRISHYRSDGRRGMMTSRIMGGHHRRTDMRSMTMHNRRYPSIRGRGDMRNRIMSGSDMMSKRTLDTKISKKVLYKRALQAAKDGYDESPSDNDEDDDEDDGGDVDATPSRSKKAKKSDTSVVEDEDEEEDEDIKEEKRELWDDDDDAGDTKSKSSARNEEDHDEDDANKTGTTVGDEGEEKEKDATTKQQTPAKKTIKKEDTKDSADGDRKASDETSENKRSTKINTKYRSSNFIKLTCAHCKIKCVTFKEYHTHLYTRSHKMKMRALAVKCRERLLEMRAAQRNAQKDEDEKSDDGTGGEDSKRPGFCMLCRLNYRQPRAIHQQSEGHKMMKKFLMPYCNICKLGFKSPMAFETHRASLDHLKIKARVERYASSTKGDESGEENPADTGDIDLDSLTIVDEVGKVDEICDPGAGGETPARKRGFGDVSGRAGTEDEDEEDDDEEDEDDENQMIIGEEHVKKVQVQYCELCNMYLPRRAENQERVLREHCKKRSHLKLYIRFRNDKKLREQAERIHKKKLKVDKEVATGTKGDEKKANDSTGTTESKPSTDSNNTGSANATESVTVKTEPVVKQEKKHDSSAGSDSTTNTTKTNASNAGNTNTTASHDAASIDSCEANLSLDGSNNLTSLSGTDGPGTLTDEQVDKLMWQVVDNDDLGDLLRDVQDDVEEEDDDKTNLERYDKFRHTEKNGLEQQRSDAAGDGVEDEEDSVSSKPQSGAGKKGTAANGGADVAANGDAGKESKTVVG
uniref:C2H2-type domain-containing protein n=1 Tax=Anopheles culicifacies TaxID=139723 RepID=A0A182M8A8_9DIPT